ncbi:hypothetical protein QR680_007558 [Steinernema hermaphroditum]|uniref:Tyrosine-protein kinase n=1 Tax=Steinernema hermaphroditum TaxID=289476 RepID=A0AA39IG01_9BILA|nr:hypothetical protein QR680_007558 [Steinernema hermaphroditum]
MTMARKIEDEDFYHGLLPREDIPYLLRNVGDYLVRSTETNTGAPRQLVLSVAIATDGPPSFGQPVDFFGRAIGIKHVVIHSFNNKFACDGKNPFDSVQQLLNFYQSSGVSVMPTCPGVIPSRAIPRQQWELRHADVHLEKKLGEGAFGEVHRGTLMLQSMRKIDVAIKIAKAGAGEMTKEKIKEMMNEARLMRNYDHRNVVKLYGVCVEYEPLMIVMELINGGSLDEYLKRNKAPLEEKIENMMCGAAWGLEYLHQKSCIHRDIAARNCLYANQTVKISDFGLSREGFQYAMRVVRRVPIKWLAPETIHSLIYNAKTDVWSFGVMVWEIFANGDEPYPGMTNAEVKERVPQGYRMDMPHETPHDIAKLITHECWVIRPENRPSMTQVVHALEAITGKAPGSWSHPKTPPPAGPLGKCAIGVSMKRTRKKKNKKDKDHQQNSHSAGDKK